MVKLLFSMRSAKNIAQAPPARRPSARALPIRSDSSLAVRLTHHFFCCPVQVVDRMHYLGVTGLLQQFRHIGPQFPPRLLLLGCQLLQRVRVTNTGQVGVALPVLERGPLDLAIFWLAGSGRLAHCSRSARSQASACWRSRR